MANNTQYEAPKFSVNFKTPRLRNFFLYAATVAGTVGIENLINCSPQLLVGAALIAYGAMFHLLNPDMFNFNEKSEYQTKIDRKKFLINPLIQPFKDAVNLVRLKKVRF